MKDQYGMMYDGKEWTLVMKDDLIDKVYENKKDYIYENLEEFIDYLVLQLWGGNWDWPQNNWTATADSTARLREWQVPCR